MLNLFFHAEMLLLVRAWSMVRWRWRARSLRPLTCWCREFSPSGLISSLLLAPQTCILAFFLALTKGYTSVIQSIFGGGVLLHSNFSSCSSVLTIFTHPFTPIKIHPIVGHLTAKPNKERRYFSFLLISFFPVILRVHLILLTSNGIEKLATD